MKGKVGFVAGVVVGVLTAGTVALASIPHSETQVITACRSTSDGSLRVINAEAGATCKAGERRLTWNQVGRRGPTGATGATGDPGPAGPQGDVGPEGPAGSPDTPQQVLDKIRQVDGSGSGLDASLLDGRDSTEFLRDTEKAADAEKVDGVNSTGLARRRTSGSGAIAMGALSANSCADLTLSIGGARPGDVVLLNVGPGDSLPARVTMTVLDVPANGQVRVRMCNGTNTASVADSDIKLVWYIFQPWG